VALGRIHLLVAFGGGEIALGWAVEAVVVEVAVEVTRVVAAVVVSLDSFGWRRVGFTSWWRLVEVGAVVGCFPFPFPVSVLRSCRLPSAILSFRSAIPFCHSVLPFCCHFAVILPFCLAISCCRLLFCRLPSCRLPFAVLSFCRHFAVILLLLSFWCHFAVLLFCYFAVFLLLSFCCGGGGGVG
jgi:hypothetical protein